MNTLKLFAFIRHGFRVATSYRLNFVARYISAGASLIFFFFLDKLFVERGLSVVEGGSYFAFVLIGSTISRYLDLGMRSFAQNLRDEMLQGTIEPLLVTATSTRLALLGPSAWMLLEGTALALLQLVIGALIGADFSKANWLSAILVSLVSLICLLCYGIISASFTLVFKRSDPINWLIGATAYVFSGVYFPVSVLPPALRVVSYSLPMTYALHGLRAALLEGSNLVHLRRDLLALLGFTAVLLPVSLWTIRYATRYLKQTGELSHY